MRHRKFPKSTESPFLLLGLKSIALALILQHPTRTLVDDEVTETMNKVIAALKGNLEAELRS